MAGPVDTGGQRLFIVCGRQVESAALRQSFESYGKIENFRLIRDKGVAYVKFSSAANAAAALEGLNGTSLQDNNQTSLKVMVAEDKAPPPPRQGPSPEGLNKGGYDAAADPDNIPPRSRLFLVCPKGANVPSLEKAVEAMEDVQYCKTDLVATKGILYIKFSRMSSAMRILEDISSTGMLAGYKVKCMIADPKVKRGREFAGDALPPSHQAARLDYGMSSIHLESQTPSHAGPRGSYSPYWMGPTPPPSRPGSVASAHGMGPSHPHSSRYTAPLSRGDYGGGLVGPMPSPQISAPNYLPVPHCPSWPTESRELQDYGGVDLPSFVGGLGLGEPSRMPPPPQGNLSLSHQGRFGGGVGASSSGHGPGNRPLHGGYAERPGVMRPGPPPSDGPGRHPGWAETPLGRGYRLDGPGSSHPHLESHQQLYPHEAYRTGGAVHQDGRQLDGVPGWAQVESPQSLCWPLERPPQPHKQHPQGSMSSGASREEQQNSDHALSQQRLFVVVAKTVAPEQLSRLFRRFSGMEYCDLKIDQTTGKSKGFAYVNYSTHRLAAGVVEQLHGSEFPPGHRLKVMFAEPMGSRGANQRAKAALSGHQEGAESSDSKTSALDKHDKQQQQQPPKQAADKEDQQLDQPEINRIRDSLLALKTSNDGDKAAGPVAGGDAAANKRNPAGSAPPTGEALRSWEVLKQEQDDGAQYEAQVYAFLEKPLPGYAIQHVFSAHGTVVKVIVHDGDERYSLICYETTEAAVKAQEALDGTDLFGIPLAVFASDPLQATRTTKRARVAV